MQNPDPTTQPEVTPVSPVLTSGPSESAVQHQLEVHASDLDDIGDESDHVQSCSHANCSEEIFAACTRTDCNVLLCYVHFLDSTCDGHRVEAQLDSSSDTIIMDQAPEEFVVEGEPRQRTTIITPEKTKSNVRLTAKIQRNLGKSYRSPNTGSEVPSRRVLKPRCLSARCAAKGFECHKFDEDERLSVLNAYYDLGNLHHQRQWIQSHIVQREPSYKTHTNKVTSRKKQTLSYYLPKGDGKLQVCRQMFLNTAGITERQVRTVLQKTDKHGILQKEKRGKRTSHQVMNDAIMRQKMKEHINRFPRMESHYCRAKTSDQYLSSNLTVLKMYELYKNETKEPERGSFSLYYTVFKELGLKFHTPKKDICGTCDSFHKASGEEKERLRPNYEEHTFQKDKVREIKTQMKERAKKDRHFCAATFDLQQVMYLPQSNRCEIFYKRRLSCYNFTVYELNSKEGHCYFWHEGQAKRGANEISSHLYHFLVSLDVRNITEVALFADGCAGQNKNSILPAMLLHVVQNAQSLKKITLYFYETSHGQSEGDSMHSTVERMLKRSGEVFLPSQLATIIRLSRHKPYVVNAVQTEDIKDWKAYSVNMGVLRTRIADDGTTAIDWKRVMQLQVSAEEPTKIYFKLTHNPDIDLSILSMNRRVQTREQGPSVAYLRSPPIAKAKYNDLVALCSGANPVIRDRSHQQFFKDLSHG